MPAKRSNPLRKIAATLAAAAVALGAMTASAVPARAMTDQDLARLLFGTAAVIVIGKAIKDQDKRRKAHAAPPVVVHPPVTQPHRGAVLPPGCAIRFDRGGPVYYGEQCLRNEGFRRLPQHCARELRERRGHSRIVYDGTCLIQAGYREVGRGHGHGRHDRRW
ncbi:MAG: hypothetical protein ACK4KW_09065 [Gemmobacter sp.]